MKELMSTIGTWPMVDTHFDDPPNYSIDHRLATLALLRIPVAYKVEVVPDPRTPGTFHMKLSPGGPHESGRTGMDIRKDTVLKRRMLSSFILLGAPYSRAAVYVDDMLTADTRYANIEQDKDRCGAVEYLYRKESISELNRLMPETDWNVLMSRVQQVTGIKKAFSVEVHCKEKIRDYLIDLNDLIPRTVYNYLGWRFFSEFEHHILADFRGSERSKVCVQLLEQYATPILAQALRLPQETVEEVQDIAADIQANIKSILSKSDWIKEAERSRLLKKLADIRFHLPQNQSSAASQNLLSQVDFENYTYAVIELRRLSVIEDLKKLNPSYVSQETMDNWRLSLTSESSSFAEASSRIYLDEVREPFFRSQGPEWLNYGSLGTVIARKLYKMLFGDELSSEDDRWWKPASECFSKSFANSHNPVEQEDQMIKLFMDTIYIGVAYQSAREGASMEAKYLPSLKQSDLQMFFISYAQSLCEVNEGDEHTQHIPSRTRVNDVVSNTAVFKEAFHCDFTTKTSIKCPLLS